MKVLHTSDWHLGRKFLAQDMHEHQEAFIDWLVATVAEYSVDLLVIAGDIFDRSVPPQESVALFERALTELSAVSPVFLIPGNHDSAVRLGYGGTFFASHGVHIQSSVESLDNPVLIEGADGVNVAVYGIPYLHPDIHAVPFGVERSHTAVLTSAMNRIRTDISKREPARTLVVSHAFVTGGSGSESERDLDIGGIGDSPARVFAGVDYTAMGHLHGPQVIASDSGLIRYSGSPLAYSFSEEKHIKSVTLVNIPLEGEVTTETIPVPQPAALVTLTGSMDYLENDSALEIHRDAWIRARITDRRRPENAMKRLSQRFSQVMHLDFVPERDSNSDADALSTQRLDPQKTPPLDVSSAFIAYVTADHISESERELVQNAIETVNAAVTTP